MAAIVVFKPGVDWQVTGGLFDCTLDYLIRHISDAATAERLQEIVDNNLGSLWLSEFPASAQREIVACLRSGLVEAAEAHLPESDYKKPALEQLQQLANLAKASEAA